MLARVAWGKVKPGTWSEYERLYRDELLPASRDVKGLAYRRLLHSTDDPDEGISITIWESREDLEAYERSATYSAFTDRVRGFFVGEYWIKHFDMVMDESLRGGG